MNHNPLARQLANHMQQALYGGNWTAVALMPALQGMNWQQAAYTHPGCNSIGSLVRHIGYYLATQVTVLQGAPLQASDAESWQYPPVASQHDWEELQQWLEKQAHTWIALVSALPDDLLDKPFAGTDKYGSWYRNLQGNIEHLHYHLGQVTLLKKWVPAP